jgi:hypothetical protein
MNNFMIKDYIEAKTSFEKKQDIINMAVRAVYKEYAKQKDVVSTSRTQWPQWSVRSYSLSEDYARIVITYTKHGYAENKDLKLPAVFVEFAAELEFEQLEKAVSILIAEEGVDIRSREQALKLNKHREKLAREDELIAAAGEIMDKRKKYQKG